MWPTATWDAPFHLWGALMMVLGQFLMFFSALNYENVEVAKWLMYGGLGGLILGNGFFKPNISSIVGRLYEPGDKRLDSAYTIFYMGVNLGAFMAPLLCGFLGDTGNPADFKWGFLAAAVIMVVSLLFYIARKNRYLVGPDGEPIGVVPANRGGGERRERTGRPQQKLNLWQLALWITGGIVLFLLFLRGGEAILWRADLFGLYCRSGFVTRSPEQDRASTDPGDLSLHFRHFLLGCI